MTLMGRNFFALLGSGLALVTTPASAQDVFDRGKSPQQIFASDCSSCHKTPQGLAKAGGLFGLQGFLREHYTVSRETAAVLARYLESVGDAPAAEPKRQQQQRRTAKPADTKPGDTKASDNKPEPAKSEAKPEAKPETKPEPKAEQKSEPNAAEPKPASNAEIKSGIAVTPAEPDKAKSE